ncbi:Glycosyltransferase involved in cell wall bisynthesis [Planococcus glaciei]|uniref:glycosyltransferase family 4 protein n=1 Tax=Planococcus glaciei TaxID=459472 RepID=UPI0008911277|nr:glycosyltransferase family 4 protein [Planococcus glaciei]SDH87136.1 Glycosyltransferase involved in cell wall bisynthesis [Planococcus glaciei]
MKILHCCLAAFYIDNYSYQENILPRMHKKQGHEVKIVASTETFIDNSYLGYTSPGSYFTEDNIPIVRLPYKKYFPQIIMRKLRMYNKLEKEILAFKPEIIFIHDCQFIDIRIIAKYAKKNPSVKIFVDCHTDFSNSAKNWVSLNILHKIVYKYCAQIIEPFTNKFYGVLPARVNFLIETYGLPKEKVELLVLGAEDDKVNEAKNFELRNKIREKYGIHKNDFLIMTGGKIDYNKPETLKLMKAIKQSEIKKLKLIVFGSVASEYKTEMLKLLDNQVHFIGWIDSKETYKYFNAADLVVFPGLHSVFWEQVVGLGKPCLFRYIKGFTHVDLGGNCDFLYENTIEELIEKISLIAKNPEVFDKMKHEAESKGIANFSYNKIAEKSISNE